MLAMLSLLVVGGTAEKFLCSSEQWGYTGTISVYASYADAKSRSNPIRPASSVPQRDGSIYIARNMGGPYDSYNAILTNWYASLTPNKGEGNPNNTNPGFFQMYDNDASNWQNQSAYFSRDLKTFTVLAKGRNAAYPSATEPGDYARLWNAGAPPASGEATKGTYLDYEYKFVATGVNGEDPDKDGVYQNGNNATGVSGYFRGVFKNESVKYPESNGYYAVDLQFNFQSWARSQNLTQADEFVSSTRK